MRFAFTEEELIGKTNRFDIISKSGLLLVPAHTRLTRAHLQLLKRYGVSPSDIKLEYAGPTSNVPSPASSLVEEALQYAKVLFDRIRAGRVVPLLDLRTQVVPYIEEISEQHQLFDIIDAVKAKDDYTYRHCIGVGVLASQIGKWLKFECSEIALLALAGLLHDVGKMQIAEELLQKDGPLTEEEFDEMKRHTLYGYELLKNTPGLNPRVALVALQHHERIDGNGYPLKLKDAQTDPMSRVVAIADVFHAMTSTRPFQAAKPFHEVVEQMRKGTFHGLDPHMVQVFLKHMHSSLIGRKVVLSNGQHGEVVYINPHDQFSPLIRVQQSFVDLSKEHHLRIQEVTA